MCVWTTYCTVCEVLVAAHTCPPGRARLPFASTRTRTRQAAYPSLSSFTTVVVDAASSRVYGDGGGFAPGGRFNMSSRGCPHVLILHRTLLGKFRFPHLTAAGSVQIPRVCAYARKPGDHRRTMCIPHVQLACSPAVPPVISSAPPATALSSPKSKLSIVGF